jgi:hypothetical protein
VRVADAAKGREDEFACARTPARALMRGMRLTEAAVAKTRRGFDYWLGRLQLRLRSLQVARHPETRVWLDAKQRAQASGAGQEETPSREEILRMIERLKLVQ